MKTTALLITYFLLLTQVQAAPMELSSNNLSVLAARSDEAMDLYLRSIFGPELDTPTPPPTSRSSSIHTRSTYHSKTRKVKDEAKFARKELRKKDGDIRTFS